MSKDAREAQPGSAGGQVGVSAHLDPYHQTQTKVVRPGKEPVSVHLVIPSGGALTGRAPGVLAPRRSDPTCFE